MLILITRRHRTAGVSPPVGAKPRIRTPDPGVFRSECSEAAALLLAPVESGGGGGGGGVVVWLLFVIFGIPLEFLTTYKSGVKYPFRKRSQTDACAHEQRSGPPDITRVEGPPEERLGTQVA